MEVTSPRAWQRRRTGEADHNPGCDRHRHGHPDHRRRGGPRPDFRPYIQGLRAVAALVVIAFPSGGISGGFIIAAETRATHIANGRYADLSELFCTTTRCPAIVGSDLVFRDDNHITVSYARRLAPVLGMFAERAIAPRS